MAVASVYKSLLAARAEFAPVLKNKTNSHFRSSYADLESVLDAVEAPLAQQGLLLVQRLEVRPDAVVLVTEVVAVADGSRSEPCVYPIQSANNADPQKLAGAVTYARRYSILMVLGLAPEDDDGNTAAAPSAPPQKPASPTPTPPAAPVPPPGPRPALASMPAASPISDGQVELIHTYATQLGLDDAKLSGALSRDFGVAQPHLLNADQAATVVARMKAAVAKKGGGK